MKTVIRQMREERCPEHVRNEVQRSVAAIATPARGLHRLRLVLGTAAAIVVVWALVFALRPGPSQETAQTVPDEQRSVPQRTARQAYASLASIGIALQEAGNRSGTIIFQETLPLLRQGLETTKNAINSQNNL